MATYDPIIHFYDDPGHPYWPNKNGGSGGGGGGATLGTLQPWPHRVNSVPVVDGTLNSMSLFVDRLLLGDIDVCAGIVLADAANVPQIASGMTIVSNALSPETKFYAVTLSQTKTYTSVRQLDVEIIVVDNRGAFVMPDLTTNNETLVIYGGRLG